MYVAMSDFSFRGDAVYVWKQYKVMVAEHTHTQLTEFVQEIRCIPHFHVIDV